jgi:HPt (histidine-containing phosphotransfer) domain-containing protein
MTDDTNPVLDLAQVAELAALDQGRGALLTRFVDLFVAGTGERIARIRHHAESAEAADLAAAAHALRGAAGNVGAVRLARVLETIEVAAKGRDLGAAGAAVALLDAEYAETRTALLTATGRSGG